MRVLTFRLGVLSLLMFPGMSIGNTPPPRPPALVPRPEEPVPRTITFQQNGRAQLIIPKKYAAPAGTPTSANTAREESVQVASTRNLMTGMALSAGFVAAGLWFVRRKRS